jgi:hypothetical protein
MPLRRRRSFGGGGGAIEGLIASLGDRGERRGCCEPWLSESSAEGRVIFFFRPNITMLFWYWSAILPVRRHPNRDYGEKP